MNFNKLAISCSRVLALVLLVDLIPVIAQESSIAPMAIALEEIQWGPPGGGNGFPVGVRTAQQGIDPVSGGITYYALFPSGSHFNLHWHTYDEFVVVVKGKITIELGEHTHTLGAGSYIVIPGHLHHSWEVPVSGGEDAIILVRRAGPADFYFVQ